MRSSSDLGGGSVLSHLDPLHDLCPSRMQVSHALPRRIARNWTDDARSSKWHDRRLQLLVCSR